MGEELTFEKYSEDRVKLIDSYIEESFAALEKTISLRFKLMLEAMRYCVGGKGKRMRPLLAMATAECLGIDPKAILPAACAIEFIHNYSLIHDDLPALDNDDMRRGKPSCHKKFGEAVAILTGDALLTEAFGEMSKLACAGNFPTDRVLEATSQLVQCAGVAGMVGGQLLDITTEPHEYTLPEVEFIHIHKTGALIRGAVMIPAILAGVEGDRRTGFRHFGEAVGLAFQISDDLLDSEPGVRYSRGPRSKPTPSYTAVMSPPQIKQKLQGLVEHAVRSLEGEGEAAEPLVRIAEFVGRRKH